LWKGRDGPLDAKLACDRDRRVQPPDSRGALRQPLEKAEVPGDVGIPEITMLKGEMMEEKRTASGKYLLNKV